MSDVYVNKVARLRKTRKLHSAVEMRLVQLLRLIHPGAALVPEVHGVLGGRNDLIMFAFDARKVVFEIFASASQVPQDLRLLEQCDAAVRIAVIIDQEVDGRVSDEYFHKRPQAFPFMWIRQLLDERWQQYAVARLKELTDENSNIVRLRKLVEGRYGNSVDAAVRKVIDKIEEQIGNENPPSARKITGGQMVAIQVIASFQQLGIPPDRLRSLYQWLVQGLEFGFTLTVLGLQAFLITDLDSQHAIWSDGDLADDLIIMSPTAPKAQVVLCLNPIINGLFKAVGLPPSKLKYHFVHTYSEVSRKQVKATTKRGNKPMKR